MYGDTWAGKANGVINLAAENKIMESNAFALSRAKNTSEPSFAARVRSNKRLATNKASAQPRPIRNPNCVGQILASAPAAFNLRSKIVANRLVADCQ